MTNTLKKGDLIRVKDSVLTLGGKTGVILEALEGSIFDDAYRAKLDGLTYPVIVVGAEVEVTGTDTTGGFKVGDKVGFVYNSYWNDGEAEVIAVKPKADFPIEVRITKKPSKNDLQKVGNTHHWEARNLKLLIEEVKEIDGFKVGDKVGFKKWNDVWADAEGVVTELDGSTKKDLNIRVKLIKKASRNDQYPVGSESYWSSRYLNHLDETTKVEKKFKTGDKVAIVSNDAYLSGAMGEVVDSDDQYGYCVKLTKVNPKNLLVTAGSTIWFTEKKLKAVEKPVLLDAHKLILKPQGAVVVDKDGRTWVLVGQQTYVHKNWDGLESLHAVALVKKYGPINERVE